MVDTLHIDLAKCCGCASCVQICPKAAISFVEDDEGFGYPVVNSDLCVQCGLCTRGCPIGKSGSLPASRISCYAAKNSDVASLEKSSSGAVFPAIAKCIINQGGVVFGAAYDGDFSVTHSFIDKIENIPLLCGSKYVQSDIGSSFRDAKSFLQKGLYVLFVGTPCQIAGLKSFLGKDYANLYTVDFICHGVPSPAVWRDYLQELAHKFNSSIVSVSFRNKDNGWKNYRMKVGFANQIEYSIIHYNDPFMKGFIHNFYLRKSCHNCQFKSNNSGSDLTLGDYWRVRSDKPKFYSHMGVSVALAKSEKGEALLRTAGLDLLAVDYSQVLRSNPSLEKATQCPENRNSFWNVYHNSKTVSETMNSLVPDENRGRSLKSLIGDLLYYIRRFL